MNKDLFFTTAVAAVLVFSTGRTEAFVVQGSNIEANICLGAVYRTQITQDNDLCIKTMSERVIQEIESEIDSLDEEKYSKETFDTFIKSAEQLKTLLINESIKKMPDVLAFHKGYIGLTWEINDNKTVFVYSLPNNVLFFNIVGENNFSEKFTTVASKNEFSALLSRINKLV